MSDRFGVFAEGVGQQESQLGVPVRDMRLLAVYAGHNVALITSSGLCETLMDAGRAERKQGPSGMAWVESPGLRGTC